jgi:hypothetical protein
MDEKAVVCEWWCVSGDDGWAAAGGWWLAGWHRQKWPRHFAGVLLPAFIEFLSR